MTTNEVRKKYWPEIKEFLESEAGTQFRITLSMMRPQGEVSPIPGVDYNQLLAADQKLRDGYEKCIVNMNKLATPPEEPEKVRPVKYNKQPRKK